MAVGAKRLIPRFLGARFLLQCAWSVVFCLNTAICQDHPRNSTAALKYDPGAETKIKGVVEEVKIFDLGTRKDFVKLLVKSGEDNIILYVCPKPFQEEIGIVFTKGDAITITGAKAKGDEAEVILARELVKGQDTFLFRDNKGNPVWDPRTGK